MRVYYFLDGRKWVLMLKLGGIVLFNILVLTGTAIYYSPFFLHVLVIQLVIDGLFAWGFWSTRKTLCITNDSLIIFYLFKKEIFLFSEMDSIRFFYAIERSRDSNRVIGRTNTCEIKLPNSNIHLEITEKEIKEFNDFKFYLLEQTGNQSE